MKILRIEAVLGDRVGDGPYRAIPDMFEPSNEGHYRAHVDAFYDGTDALIAAAGRPTPDRDGIGFMFPEEVCGFESAAQLLRWFPERPLRRLLSTGYYGVFSYEVPERVVRRGQHQVVFERLGHAKTRVDLDALISSEQPSVSGRTPTLEAAR